MYHTFSLMRTSVSHATSVAYEGLTWEDLYSSWAVNDLGSQHASEQVCKEQKGHVENQCFLKQ